MRLEGSEGLGDGKPGFAVVICLKRIEHDGSHFSLILTVEDVIFAPEDFDSSVPLRLTSAWNAPNLLITAGVVQSLYSFSIYFSPNGAERLAELLASPGFDEIMDERAETGHFLMWAGLRSCLETPRQRRPRT